MRAATPEDEADVRAICDMAIATLRKTYRPTTETIHAQGDGPSTLPRVVAAIDGAIVGTVQYRLSERSLICIGLAVHDNFRNRGVARSMFDSLSDLGRILGADRLVLWSVRQTGNIPIFLRLGFIPIREEPSLLFESETHQKLSEVLMERPILGRRLD